MASNQLVGYIPGWWLPRPGPGFSKDEEKETSPGEAEADTLSLSHFNQTQEYEAPLDDTYVDPESPPSPELESTTSKKTFPKPSDEDAEEAEDEEKITPTEA